MINYHRSNNHFVYVDATWHLISGPWFDALTAYLTHYKSPHIKLFSLIKPQTVDFSRPTPIFFDMPQFITWHKSRISSNHLRSLMTETQIIRYMEFLWHKRTFRTFICEDGTIIPAHLRKLTYESWLDTHPLFIIP